jgi:hypothetical protein
LSAAATTVVLSDAPLLATILGNDSQAEATSLKNLLLSLPKDTPEGAYPARLSAVISQVGSLAFTLEDLGRPMMNPPGIDLAICAMFPCVSQIIHHEGGWGQINKVIPALQNLDPLLVKVYPFACAEDLSDERLRAENEHTVDDWFVMKFLHSIPSENPSHFPVASTLFSTFLQGLATLGAHRCSTPAIQALLESFSGKSFANA